MLTRQASSKFTLVYLVMSLVHSFIHPTHLLSIYYVLRTYLGSRDIAVHKTEKDPSPEELQIYGNGQQRRFGGEAIVWESTVGLHKPQNPLTGKPEIVHLSPSKL